MATLKELIDAAKHCRSKDPDINREYWSAVAFDLLPFAADLIYRRDLRIIELESQIKEIRNIINKDGLK
jgi:hypothetical protein